LLKKASGYDKGARIELEKRIPWGAGLGGGSSDGAATLVALNKLWGLKLTTPDLVKLAAQLGSDVPFFIQGGTALIEGRGEKVMPIEAPLPRWFILLIPPLPKMPDKTQQLYSRLNTKHFTDGQFVDRAVASWCQDKKLSPNLFFNVFDKVSFDAFPGLDDYWRSFEKVGAVNIHLAGSGPTLFTSVDSESGAKEIQRQLCQQRLEAYAVSTIVDIAAQC
jgi:4-diphosphocytidyl-2-C-methyl-D-erythritol kinase